MDFANNPGEGTGTAMATETTVADIKSLLDSENTTTENVDAEEVDETSNTETEEEVDDVEDADEQPEEDSDEDADDTDEDDASDEVKDETDEEEGDGLKEDTLVDVQGQKIPLKELKLGYMRQSDYTRKMQGLKNHMARYQLEQKDRAEVRVEVANQIKDFKKYIAATIPEIQWERPDFDALYPDDPFKAGAEERKWNRQNDLIQQMHAMDQEISAKEAKWQEEQLALKQAEAFETFATKYPEFADKQKAPAMLSEMGAFLVEQGFAGDEIETIADSRIFDVVYRLMKAEAVAKQAPKVIKQLEKKPKLTSPGTSTTTVKSRPKSDVEVNMRKYKQTGDSRYSVAAIKDLLDNSE